MFYIKIILIPLIGGFIGWLTNMIAIWLLFRPYEKYTVPVIGLEIWGLIPKRRHDIAVQIGNVIEQELLRPKDIVEAIGKTRIKDDIVESISGQLEKRLEHLIPPLLQTFLPQIASTLQDVVTREVNLFFDENIDSLLYRIHEDVSISTLVQEKIDKFSLRKVEEIIYTIARKELKHIEWLGGILGFIIGIGQVFVMLIFD